jgi:hypothetical protein
LDFELIGYPDMTAAAMPVNAPHTKGTYVAVAVCASLSGLAFLWKAFARVSLAGRPLDTPVAWRLVQAGCGAVLLLGALLALERWLAPARAQARSAAISNAARRRLLLLSRALVGIGVATCIGNFAILVIWRGYVGDISVFGGVLIFAGYFVADLCGERG